MQDHNTIFGLFDFDPEDKRFLGSVAQWGDPKNTHLSSYLAYGYPVEVVKSASATASDH